MIDRVKKAIEQSSVKIDYSEILVETEEEAETIKFRGTPTLIIDGIDFDDLEEPEKGTLACRYYPNGLPTEEEIILKIEKKGMK